MPQDHAPPPGAVHELAERAVEFVRRAVGVPLDYTPETLPALDHYLGTIPRDQPDLVKLCAATAGAYFGEVVRKEIGGEWDTEGAPSTWRLRLSGGLTLAPIGCAAEVILADEAEGYDGAFDVADDEREAVACALALKGDVPADEYYSLCGRLETLLYVAEVVAARRATRS